MQDSKRLKFGLLAGQRSLLKNYDKISLHHFVSNSRCGVLHYPAEISSYYRTLSFHISKLMEERTLIYLA